ncbi:FlgD immunoglobulin-like domain containing protein [Micromonospora sp. CPCC 205561]|uniref:FlgD immunoglobulin-like domain containing protein n=1 Tax=Micromonospora sp. CPCC 205561 TaxID=3122407 RepID=UPI002FF1C09F
MARRALLRGGIAATMSFTLAIGLVPLTTGAAGAAAATAEVLIPAPTVLRPRTALLSAGPSGFLRHEYGRGHLWTSYAGVDTVVDASATDVHTMPDFGAGSDVVARYDATARTVKLRDMSAGGSRTVALPAGHEYSGTLGWTVVTTTGSSGAADITWHLIDTRADGSHTRRAVQGVPAGITATFETNDPLGDARGQVVRYRMAEGGRTGWLDVDQGRLVPLPQRGDQTEGQVVLTPTHLLFWRWADRFVAIHPRDDLTAAPRTVPLAADAQLLGMVGETLVVSRHDPSLGRHAYDLPVWRVEAVAPDGSTVKTLLARSAGRGVPTPGGGLLVAGGPGTDWDQWGVSLVEATDGGAVTVRRIAGAHPQRLQKTVDELSLTQGRLDTLEYDPSIERRHLFTRDIGVTGPLTVGARLARGAVHEGCAFPVCVRQHPTGDGRTVVSGVTGTPQPHLLEPDQPLPGTPVDSSRSYASVAAASGRFVALRTRTGTGTGTPAPTPTGPDEGASETRVVDLDTRQTVFTTTAGVAAMWGSTLWERVGNDAVAPVDVLTGQRGDQVWFGRGCLLEDFQAVGRWLLWTCLGSAEGQGVHDTVTKRNLTLVSGSGWSRAKLGDGFVASEADGQLRVTDVRSGTPVSHHLGEFSSWRPWDIDPYTATIAHVGADSGIHLVPSGIPVSPLVQLDAAVAPAARIKGSAGHWKPKWWLSKPAASWTLVITNPATGATVNTLSGGLARGLVTTTWNGQDRLRRPLPDGAYAWTLTATPADGQGAVLTRSGTVNLTNECQIGRTRRAVGCS